MPRVSVIIPVYNSERYIAETLESVFAQTFRDFEVLVIDDGSTDGTQRVLDAYQERITYLHNDHGGPASSRNRGLDAASGLHIAFLDSDDLWHPEKLRKQITFAEAHPDYGIITTDASVFDHTGMLASSSKAGKYIPSGDVLEFLLLDNWIGTSCAMVRRECLEKVGKFDEERFVWGEDWVMWMRVAAQYPVYFLDEVLVQYRVHPQGYSRANLEKHFHDLLYDLDKLEKTVPRLAAKPELLREARFRLCQQGGWEDLQCLELERARYKLRRSLRYKPYGLKALALLGIACIPAAILRPLKHTLRSARRRFLNDSVKSE